MRLLYLFFQVCPFFIFGQKINGLVRDSITGQGIDFATVYFNGTTQGSVSDKEGVFSMNFQGIDFPCQLIVSHVSYQTRVINLDTVPADFLIVETSPKVVFLKQVTVSDKNLRKKNVKYFKNAFLGSDAWGKKAFLANDSVLTFLTEYIEEDSDIRGLTGKYRIFRVTSSAPIKINLPKLGYDLQMDLLNFEVRNLLATNIYQMKILGYYYYQPRKLPSKSKEIRTEKNRLKAYYYSPQHFTRSLFQGKLSENGYFVYETEYIPERKTYVIHRFVPDSFLIYISGGALLKGLKDRHFYLKYYGNNRGYPVASDKGESWLREQSEIYFPNDVCLIRKDGTRPDESIVFGPGIGSKRVGASLPYDYNPGKK